MIYRKYKAESLIITSFISAILIGMALLKLPWVVRPGIVLSWIDALFMSTSAVCVTGLSVVDISKDFTLFGQSIMLLLIQLGGLGIMTFSILLAMLFGIKTSFTSRFTVMNLSEGIDISTLRKALCFVFGLTFIIELLGAMFLFCVDSTKYLCLHLKLFSALFHSISAFCNAGFSLYTDSLISLQNNSFFLSIMMILIFLGGLGFIVIHEIVMKLRLLINKRRARLSLNARICLSGSFLLIIIGFVLIFCLESSRSGVLHSLSLKDQVVNSMFLSITSRTAGFNSVSISTLSNATLFFMMFLMFVGGCAGSTAGGIKVNTFFVLLSTIISKLRGYKMVSIYKKTIDEVIVGKSVAIFVIACILIVLVTGILQIAGFSSIMQRNKFLDIFFEVTSAFGTVGLSTGITECFSVLGKLLLIILMFLGRIGPITLGLLIINKMRARTIFSYPKEDVIIG